MKNYHVVTYSETEKYRIMALIRAAGAVVTNVSGYGTGYYIQFDATPDQVETINAGIGGAA